MRSAYATAPTLEEIDALARQLFKECGGRDNLEWGAVDESVRLFYRVMAKEELSRANS